jgi:hypothetical protein
MRMNGDPWWNPCIYPLPHWTAANVCRLLGPIACARVYTARYLDDAATRAAHMCTGSVEVTRLHEACPNIGALNERISELEVC